MEYLRQRHHEIQDKYRPYMGYIYGLIATLLYVVENYKIRDISPVHMPQLLFYRRVSNLIMIFLYLRFANIPLQYSSKKLNQTFVIIGVILVGVKYLSSYGVERSNLSDTLAFSQLIPILTTILGAIFLKEAADITQSVVTILSIIGSMLILKPSFLIGSETIFDRQEHPERGLGNISLVFSAFLFAVSLVLSRKIVVQNVDPQVCSFYSNIFLAMVAMPGFMATGFQSLDGTQLVNVCWVCFLGSVAQSLFLQALKYNDAGKVALTIYGDVPFRYAFDVILFGYAPQFSNILGVLLIFSCLFVQILKDSIFKFVRGKTSKKSAEPEVEIEFLNKTYDL